MFEENQKHKILSLFFFYNKYELKTNIKNQ